MRRSVLSSVFLLFLLVVVAWVNWQESKVTETRSRVLFVTQQEGFLRTRFVDLPDTSWKLLSSRETKELLNDLIHFKGGHGGANGLEDSWGRLLRVAVRRSPIGEFEFAVSSDGPDKMPGTEDDVRSCGQGSIFAPEVEALLRKAGKTTP